MKIRSGGSDRARSCAGRAHQRPAATAWPMRACAVRELLPRLAAIRRAEQGGVFDPGQHGVRVGQRWFEMPDSLETSHGCGVRRTRGACRARRRRRTCSRTGSHVLPPSFERASPGRTSHWSARIQPGSGQRATPSGDRSPSPQSGARRRPTVHAFRRRQDERPLRVPTSTRTPLMRRSSMSIVDRAASKSTS